MTGFVTIMVLICQLNVSQTHPKDLFCFDKGVENLRGSDVKEHVTFDFYKCNDRYFKDCNTDFSKHDGCKFTMTNKTIYYSSYTCP